MVQPASTTDSTPRTRRWPDTAVQALSTGIGGGAAFVAGRIATAASLGQWQAMTPLALLSSLAMLLWLAGVAVLALVMRRRSALAFASVAVVLAPVATLAESLLRTGWDMLVAYPYLFVGVIWQSLGLTGAALIGAIVGVLARRRREAAANAQGPVAPAAGAPAGDSALDATTAVEPVAPDAESAVSRGRGGAAPAGLSISLLVIGAALAFALPTQWLSVYFRVGGDAPVVTAAQGDRYLWTAGLSLALLIGALVAAIIRRRAGLIILTAFAVGCALIGAFVFQVPQGRFWPDPAPITHDDDFPVCYGTTGDCPGG